MVQETNNSMMEDKESLIFGRFLSSAPSGEEVVISGISGQFPKSDNMHELRDNFMNHVDMIGDHHRHWNRNDPRLIYRVGNCKDIEHFDTAFFDVHHEDADNMCPMLRCLFERIFEAIVDAGVNPASLKGTRTGVYIAVCTSESETSVLYEKEHSHGLPVKSVGRNMFPSRISYWLGVTGPSLIIDCACSSALFALNQAYEHMRLGIVDRAVVASCNLILDLASTIGFDGLGVLNDDGKVKAFDDRANGYTRSEAIPAVFVQRAKDAKRIYTSIVHSKVNNDGYKPEGITYPGKETQEMLFRDFYQECDISPTSIHYMEGHATGTEAGDFVEMNAIDEIFCAGRNTPLPIGSSKSNLGHSEASSGLCSLAKVVISMETGIIPANLHYQTPRAGIPGLSNGKLQVVTENQPLPGDLVGVNGFGFGGTNAHILFKRNKKEKVNGGAPLDRLPRLVLVSGRNMEAVTTLMDDVESRPVDAEFVALLHDVFAQNIAGHSFRGYTLLTGGDKTIRDVQLCKTAHQSVWFAFSGFEDHCLDMGRSLLEITQFAALVKAVDGVLKPLGLSIEKAIRNSHQTDPDDIHKFLMCVAVQIGVVDIFSAVGITADGLLSHRTGEIVSAYADGCLSAQQAILVAYYFAHMTHKNPKLNLNHCLQQIIAEPKRRSKRWISATLAGDVAEFASPEYFSQCLRRTNFSREALRHIDENAIVIDFTSPGILKTLLNYSSRNNTRVFSLSSTFENDGAELVFTLIGRLYMAGLQPQVSKLYPPVTYPVSRGTPMISPLIRWEHTKEWTVPGLKKDNKNTSEKLVTVKLQQSKDSFYAGHVVDGRNLFPATGYLWIVWDEFCQQHGANYMLSVVFKDVRFSRATTLTPDGKVDFIISIQRQTGYFEVSESNTAIVTGRILFYDQSGEEMLVGLKKPEPLTGANVKDLEDKDIYKELRLRGYSYKDMFRGLIRIDNSASTGLIKWNDNWVGFMDTMLQMRILSKDSRSLFVPTGIDTIIIDPTRHRSELLACEKPNELPIYAWDSLNVVRAGGVEIRGMGASSITRRKPLGEPVLERYQYIPHESSADGALSLDQTIRMAVHIVLENRLGVKVRVYEVANSREGPTDGELLSPSILSAIGDLPLLQGETFILINEDDPRAADLDPGLQLIHEYKLPSDQSALLTVGTNVINNPDLMSNMVDALEAEGCIIAREALNVDLSGVRKDLQIIMDRVVGNDRFILLRKMVSNIGSPTIIRITEKNLSWLPELQATLKNKKPDERVVLVAQGEPQSGILGLYNCIRREPGGNMARCFFIVDPDAPDFDPSLPLYHNQLQKDLAVNVLQDGQWGSYRHLLLDTVQNVVANHGYNNVRLRGDLSSLTWFEGPISDVSRPEDLIHIYYSALNFRDIMLSTGRLSPEAVTKDRTKMDILQGFEFSGRDSSGRRIMGMSDSSCFANLMKKKSGLFWEVPDSWTLEEAATVPIVYATAIYALKVEGRLQPGETVLIHAGSGGVGQAAINYCLHHGCTVFTTVGTPEKREFIKKQFPQITDDHIGNSRDLTFEELITRGTEGRGVDLVLNSLAEEKLRASIRCLARGGRFIEIGKFDMDKNNTLAIDMFRKDQSFHSVFLDLFFNASREEQILLAATLEDAIKEGSVKPLVRTVFESDQVEKAFRFMASGKHIGKVLIRIKPEEENKTAKPTIKPMEVCPRFYCDPSLTYIVLGGLGGFGLELTDWLVLRGARKLVLTSRKGITTGYQSFRLHMWRNYGAKVTISTVDVSTMAGATKLITESNAIGPVGGIFNLAVVLRDALLENQTEETFQESFRGKAMSTRHLDVLSRRLCPQLQQFVVFSSVSCGRGNAGQTNYGMSNSVMERICEARVRDGLPAVAIQWGAVGDVGLVADMQEEQHELVIGGTLQQKITSCLEVMDTFLKQPHPVVASMVVAEKRSSTGKFASIVDCVANILGLRDVKTVSAMSPLTELGMDSIMAVEIKQAIEREYEVFLTPQEIRNLTFKNLLELASNDKKNESKVAGGPEESSQDDAIEPVFSLTRSKQLGTEVVVSLPSTTPHVTHTPMFMLPGLEGAAASLAHLALNIAGPCVGLQHCFLNQTGDAPEMAISLLQHVRKMTVPKKRFSLLGHSFGGDIALEMAASLEEEGYSGQIFLIDSTPKFVRQLAEQHVVKGATTEVEMQINLLANILCAMSQVTKEDIDEMAPGLAAMSSWSERLEKVLGYGEEEDKEYNRSVLNALWFNIQAIRKYSWPQGRIIKSPITLIRPKFTRMRSEGDSEDSGLSEICEKPVDLHFVEGDHATILKNPVTAEIINKILRGETAACEE